MELCRQQRQLFSEETIEMENSKLHNLTSNLKAQISDNTDQSTVKFREDKCADISSITIPLLRFLIYWRRRKERAWRASFENC